MGRERETDGRTDGHIEKDRDKMERETVRRRERQGHRDRERWRKRERWRVRQRERDERDGTARQREIDEYLIFKVKRCCTYIFSNYSLIRGSESIFTKLQRVKLFSQVHLYLIIFTLSLKYYFLEDFS